MDQFSRLTPKGWKNNWVETSCIIYKGFKVLFILWVDICLRFCFKMLLYSTCIPCDCVTAIVNSMLCLTHDYLSVTNWKYNVFEHICLQEQKIEDYYDVTLNTF